MHVFHFFVLSKMQKENACSGLDLVRCNLLSKMQPNGSKSPERSRAAVHGCGLWAATMTTLQGFSTARSNCCDSMHWQNQTTRGVFS
jgi:hypothetical protein